MQKPLKISYQEISERFLLKFPLTIPLITYNSTLSFSALVKEYIHFFFHFMFNSHHSRRQKRDGKTREEKDEVLTNLFNS